jgi:hypothetical protein
MTWFSWALIYFFLLYSKYVLGDSKWLWTSIATMHENPCGNPVGGAELTFVWHFISVHLIFFIPVHIDLTIFKIVPLWTAKEMSSIPSTQPPHKSSYTAATPIHNHFESLNTISIVLFPKEESPLMFYNDFYNSDHKIVYFDS